MEFCHLNLNDIQFVWILVHHKVAYPSLCKQTYGACFVSWETDWTPVTLRSTFRNQTFYSTPSLLSYQICPFGRNRNGYTLKDYHHNPRSTLMSDYFGPKLVNCKDVHTITCTVFHIAELLSDLEYWKILHLTCMFSLFFELDDLHHNIPIF